MLLGTEGKQDFLKTKFHQYFDITLDGASITDDEDNGVIQFVNFVLPLTKLNEVYDLTEFGKYFNEEYNNVIFTPSENHSNIYDYEFYQGVYFIRLKPFSKNVRMHILPKKYDASNTKTDHPILFFKDNKQNIDENNFSCTQEYERKTDKNNINLYFKEDEEINSNGFYKFDIKDKTRGLKNLQINLGYSYNDTNPTEKNWHFTGVIDESNENGRSIEKEEFTEYNSCLMDVNCDNKLDYTNKILQQKFDQNNDIDWDDSYSHQGGFNNQHPIETLFHKTLKYFNDDLYIEENGKYHIINWIELINEGS